MFLKNKITNEIGQFANSQGEDWIELTENEIDIYELRQAKQIKKAQCQTYLQNTDWQAAAFIKYNRPIDSNVSENCLRAKQLKKDIEACTTLEELNKINTDF